MTKVTIALTALFSVCVAAGQTVGADSPARTRRGHYFGRCQHLQGRRSGELPRLTEGRSRVCGSSKNIRDELFSAGFVGEEGQLGSFRSETPN